MEGKIFADCDISYDMQNDEEYVCGKITQGHTLADTIRGIADSERED